MAKANAVVEVDELDSIINGASTPTDADAPAPTVDSFDAEFGGELSAPALDDYDLSGAISLDFRLLGNKKWYEAEVIGARDCVSGAGNPQIEFILRVTAGEKGEHDYFNDGTPNPQGAPVEGITVYVFAPTPRPPLDAKKIQSLATLKDVGGACGLADFNANGVVQKLKPGVVSKTFIGCKLRFRNECDVKFDPNGRNKATAFAASRIK